MGKDLQLAFFFIISFSACVVNFYGYWIVRKCLRIKIALWIMKTRMFHWKLEFNKDNGRILLTLHKALKTLLSCRHFHRGRGRGEWVLLLWVWKCYVLWRRLFVFNLVSHQESFVWDGLLYILIKYFFLDWINLCSYIEPKCCFTFHLWRWNEYRVDIKKCIWIIWRS